MYELGGDRLTYAELADSDAGIATGALDTDSGDLQRLIGRDATPFARALSAPDGAVIRNPLTLPGRRIPNQVVHQPIRRLCTGAWFIHRSGDEGPVCTIPRIGSGIVAS